MSRRTKDLLKINPWPGILERRIDARLKADAIRAAKDRVAEAALKGEDTGHGNHEICLWFDRAEDCEGFGRALDDLRRLKGEG